MTLDVAETLTPVAPAVARASTRDVVDSSSAVALMVDSSSAVALMVDSSSAVALMVDSSSAVALMVERFEACSLPSWAFGHREHLFVAWTYLRSSSFEEGAARFVTNLKRFATHHGATTKFHATITWTLLQAIAEAIDAHPSLDFDAFLAAHTDLLDVRTLLAARFDRDTLDSDRARRIPLLSTRS